MISQSHGIFTRRRGFSPNQPWSVLATLGNAGGSFDISQDTSAISLAVSPEGLRAFVLGGQNDTIYEFSLSEQRQIKTSTYTGVSLAISSETSPTTIRVGASGTRMYITGTSTDDIREYVLTYPWDLSTASFLRIFDPTTITGGAGTLSFDFSNDGFKMYVLGDDDTVYQTSLSAPWDVSTVMDDSATLDLSNESGTVLDIRLGDDGNYLYALSSTDTAIYRYDLATAYDLSTASYAHTNANDITGNLSNISGFDISPDGKDLYLISSASSAIEQRKMGDKIYSVKYFLVDENFNYLVDENKNRLIWESSRP